MPVTGRVLVTGATGFIGRHCLAPLVERGFDVHAVSHERPAFGDVHWHAADLLDGMDRRRLIASVQPTHLLHAAWYLEPGKYTGSPRNLDWVIASLDLARLFQAGGGQRLLTVGSCFEYDFGAPVLDESAPLRPGTVYGASKQALGTAVAALSQATGISSAWARLFFLYGPNEDRRRLVADIATALLEGREVATSEGRQRRDYLFVEDAGDALAALLASPVEGAVNVASGDAPPVRELVSAIADTVGRPELVKFGARPAPPGDPAEIRADVRRLATEVGWSRVTPTRSAIQATVDWWRSALGDSR